MVLEELTDSFILNLKKNNWIVYNKENSCIEIISKFNCEEDEIKDSVVYFENAID